MIRFAMIAICLACVSIGAAGCGNSGKHVPGTDSSTARQDDAIEATLDIRITNIGSRNRDMPGMNPPSTMACTRSIPATCTTELVCPKASDAPPWHAKSCAYLAKKSQDLLAKPAADQVCTELYGGPEVVHVTGTVKLPGKAAQPVDISAGRNNGCEIARFDKLAPLWGQSAAA